MVGGLRCRAANYLVILVSAILPTTRSRFAGCCRRHSKVAQLPQSAESRLRSSSLAARQHGDHDARRASGTEDARGLAGRAARGQHVVHEQDGLALQPTTRPDTEGVLHIVRASRRALLSLERGVAPTTEQTRTAG